MIRVRNGWTSSDCLFKYGDISSPRLSLERGFEFLRAGFLVADCDFGGDSTVSVVPDPRHVFRSPLLLKSATIA